MELISDAWQARIDNPQLSLGDIHIWRTSLLAEPEKIQYYKQVLNDEEKQRARRFRFDKHRNRFIIARGVLRHLLAKYLASQAPAIEFDYLKHGKPTVKQATTLRFNLSHSHDLAVYAFALKHDVGVDVEYIHHQCEHQEIAKRFFSSNEYQAFASLPETEKTLAFFAAWTRKEAFIKAVGDGLSYCLSHFDVSLTPDQAPAILRIENEPQAVKQWHLHAFRPAEDYISALAYKHPITNVDYCVWEHDN